MKLYVVMQRCYDYNDNYYFSTDGGDVVKVFDNKEKAQKERMRLTRKYIKGLEVNRFRDFFQDDLIEFEEDVIRQGSFRDKWAVMQDHDVDFYYVQEVTGSIKRVASILARKLL